jgi:hypothetical protein
MGRSVSASAINTDTARSIYSNTSKSRAQIAVGLEFSIGDIVG